MQKQYYVPPPAAEVPRKKARCRVVDFAAESSAAKVPRKARRKPQVALSCFGGGGVKSLRADASERVPATAPPTIARARANAKLARFFMAHIIPFLPRSRLGVCAAGRGVALRLAGWVYYSKNWRRAAKFAAAVLPEPDYRAGATENGDGALAGGIDAAHDKAREIPATVKQPTRAGSDELRENLRTAAFAD